MKKVLYLGFIFALLPCSWVQGSVISGNIVDWPESISRVQIGDGTNHVTLSWSINYYNKGWFYGSSYTTDSDVAFAAGVTDISQIVNASAFSFSSSVVGPLNDSDADPKGIGDFVVWKNIYTAHYGVLRIDDIAGDWRIPGSCLSGKWWFQTDGTGDFSGTPVPEPSTFLLVGSGLVGIIGLGRFKK